MSPCILQFALCFNDAPLHALHLHAHAHARAHPYSRTNIHRCSTPRMLLLLSPDQGERLLTDCISRKGRWTAISHYLVQHGQNFCYFIIAYAFAHGSFLGMPADCRNAWRSNPVTFDRGAGAIAACASANTMCPTL